jgi:hypothetical protein
MVELCVSLHMKGLVKLIASNASRRSKVNIVNEKCELSWTPFCLVSYCDPCMDGWMSKNSFIHVCTIFPHARNYQKYLRKRGNKFASSPTLNPSLNSLSYLCKPTIITLPFLQNEETFTNSVCYLFASFLVPSISIPSMFNWFRSFLVLIDFHSFLVQINFIPSLFEVSFLFFLGPSPKFTTCLFSMGRFFLIGQVLSKRKF